MAMPVACKHGGIGPSKGQIRPWLRCRPGRGPISSSHAPWTIPRIMYSTNFAVSQKRTGSEHNVTLRKSWESQLGTLEGLHLPCAIRPTSAHAWKPSSSSLNGSHLSSMTCLGSAMLSFKSNDIKLVFADVKHCHLGMPYTTAATMASKRACEAT